MGGQSIESALFPSDENARGSWDGGNERSSDRGDGIRWRISKCFNDSFGRNSQRELLGEIMPGDGSDESIISKSTSGVMTSRTDNVSMQNHGRGVCAYLNQDGK